MRNYQLLTFFGIFILAAVRTVFVATRPSRFRTPAKVKCRFCTAPIAGPKCDYCGSSKWRISIRRPLIRFKR